MDGEQYSDCGGRAATYGRTGSGSHAGAADGQRHRTAWDRSQRGSTNMGQPRSLTPREKQNRAMETRDAYYSDAGMDSQSGMGAEQFSNRGGRSAAYGRSSSASHIGAAHGQRQRTTSNAFACGSNQNCGNMMTDIPSTRVRQPPGGHSSLSRANFGWDDPECDSTTMGHQSSSTPRQSGLDNRDSQFRGAGYSDAGMDSQSCNRPGNYSDCGGRPAPNRRPSVDCDDYGDSASMSQQRYLTPRQTGPMNRDPETRGDFYRDADMDSQPCMDADQYSDCGGRSAAYHRSESSSHAGAAYGQTLQRW